MILRSLLFVPGDSEKKLQKAQSTGADAIVLDLEDAVSPERIEIARSMVREYLASRPDRTHQQIWVRINPFSSPLSLPHLTQALRILAGQGKTS